MMMSFIAAIEHSLSIFILMKYFLFQAYFQHCRPLLKGGLDISVDAFLFLSSAGGPLGDVRGPIDWICSRRLEMGLSAEHDKRLRTFTSGAVRKAIVEYGHSSKASSTVRVPTTRR